MNNDQHDIDWSSVIARADRRAYLGKYMPLCPQCRADQVQLLDHLSEDDAQWRCRICKHRFIYEPPKLHNKTETKV